MRSTIQLFVDVDAEETAQGRDEPEGVQDPVKLNFLLESSNLGFVIKIMIRNTKE